MKHTRLMLAFAFASLISSSSLAASLTMLQFGSFETRAEAQKRLTEVTAKHSAFLGKLATNIREVKLPPDNLTVYRTQAGPIESRASAQSICSQLASSGDECYIVQTAMVGAPTTMADAKTAVTAPVAAAISDTKADVAKAVDAATPDVTSTLSTLSGASARDPLNRAALGNVGSTLAAASVADKVMDSDDMVDAAASSQVNKALDSAISKKPETDASLASISKASSSPRHGFWSRINPFNDDDVPAKARVVKAPDVVAAPVDDVSVAALDVPSVTVEKPAMLLPSVATPEVVVAAPKLMVDAPTLTAAAPTLTAPENSVVSLSRTPIKLDSTPVIMVAQPMQLPPPPAPLKAQDRAELAAGIKPALSQPEAIAVGPITTPAVNGSVQVEEAKRVPVTQTLVPPSAAAPAVARAQTPAALRPSATDGQKTIWAQVGPFANEQAALAYWTAYRQNHPDFPVVRVRATTPLQASATKPQSWLRVGPVANAGFVSNLCGSLTAQAGLRCGAVRDSGASSPLTAPATKQMSTPRYKR